MYTNHVLTSFSELKNNNSDIEHIQNKKSEVIMKEKKEQKLEITIRSQKQFNNSVNHSYTIINVLYNFV